MKTLVISKQYQILAEDEELWIIVTNMQLKPIRIAKFIGTPTCALISKNEKCAMIGGYGLMLINLDDFLYNSDKVDRNQAITTHLRDKNQKFWIDSIWQDIKSGEDVVHFQSQLIDHSFNLKNKQLMNLGKVQKTNSKDLDLVLI